MAHRRSQLSNLHLALAVLVLLLSLRATGAAAQYLTAAEIEAIVAGNSLTGYWQNAELKQHFARDGRAFRQRERGEVVEGRWHADANRHLLCTTYPDADEAHCFRAQRRGAKIVLFESETGYPLHATLVTGNVLAGVTAAAKSKRGSGTAPSGATRSHLNRDDLFAPAYVGGGPVHNGHFMPGGDAKPAIHRLRGRITVPDFALLGRLELGRGYEWFPGFSVEFFSLDGRLVPVGRDLIYPVRSKSRLALILSPGRIWSEPEDGGLSRASFPFVLAPLNSNNAHNGIATFLFDGRTVSSLRVQVVQETAPAFKLDAWGQGRMTYRPGAPANIDRLERQFRREIADRIEIQPWSKLAARHGAKTLADFDPYTFGDDLSTAGLIIDGVAYVMPCRTRFGDYPYCAEMRHGAFGLSKTLGAAVALLRLAQKYGDWVFDLRINNYVDVTATHDGWARVTFADALNMATGIGDKVPPFRTADDSENARQSAEATSIREKLKWIFRDGNQPGKPGTNFRYRSGDTIVLAAAMDALLKRQEGPEATLWRMVTEEVLMAIGIPVLPTLHSREADSRTGVPLLGYGLYPNIDDAAKLATLLRNRGRHNGRQLLYPAVLNEIFDRTQIKGLASESADERYYMSFRLWTYRGPGDVCRLQIPYSSGVPGPLLAFLPNGMTAFRFADNQKRPLQSMARVAARLRPFCP